VNAIVHAIEKALSHYNYFAKFGPGRPALMNKEKMQAIFNKLATRLGMTDQDEAGFTISAGMAKHFLKVRILLTLLTCNFICK
jgi:hypothetical protein